MVFLVDICLDQALDGRPVARSTHIEHELALLVAALYAGAVLDQKLDGAPVSAGRGEVQRGVVVAVTHVRVCPIRQQQTQRLRTTFDRQWGR